MDITVRSALPRDAEYLLRLEEVCMRAYAEALWGSWNRTTTPETFDLTGHFVIERGGTVVGCIAETWHDDHLFISKLYIDAPFQSQGIGAVVLRRKTQEAALIGLSTALSVLANNPADEFYRREGFQVVTETSERRRMEKPIEPTAAFGDTRRHTD